MLQYLTKTEKKAKNADEAKLLALKELGINEDDAEIEVVEEGSKGFLGIGSKDAKVIVTAKDANSVIAKTFLSKIFNAMDMDVEISAKTNGENLNVEISGDHMGIVIGKRGDTLDALQYLTSLVINHDSDKRIRVILDTEDYRAKRQDALIALSNRLADKVARTSKKYPLEPMNPYERRIIHTTIQEIEGVDSHSIGSESDRRVVITLAEGFKATNPSGGRNRRGDYRRSDNRSHSKEQQQPTRAPRSDLEGTLYGKIEPKNKEE